MEFLEKPQKLFIIISILNSRKSSWRNHMYSINIVRVSWEFHETKRMFNKRCSLRTSIRCYTVMLVSQYFAMIISGVDIHVTQLMGLLLGWYDQVWIFFTELSDRYFYYYDQFTTFKIFQLGIYCLKDICCRISSREKKIPNPKLPKRVMILC